MSKKTVKIYNPTSQTRFNEIITDLHDIGYTLKEIACACKCSVPTICNHKSGRYPISRKVAEDYATGFSKLDKRFDYSPEFILGIEDEKKNKNQENEIEKNIMSLVRLSGFQIDNVVYNSPDISSITDIDIITNSIPYDYLIHDRYISFSLNGQTKIVKDKIVRDLTDDIMWYIRQRAIYYIDKYGQDPK